MRLDILTTDGSPLGVTSKTVWGDAERIGVGGAELALITMCEEWTKAGHEVTLFNNPVEFGVSPFEQRNLASFDPQSDRDVLIVFRTPNDSAILSKGLKVWWSTDQYTRMNFAAFAPYVDKIVCISPHHCEYFRSTYGISNAAYIDLPVRVNDYSIPLEKVENRFIFTSVPDRGLENLHRIWRRVVQEFPTVSLVITSDYRLWGAGSARNDRHRMKWLERSNFNFLGAVDRKRLIEEQLKAEILLYPCNYEELFCIAVAEQMVAGGYPVTSGIGALKSTNMGTIIDVDANDPHNDGHFFDAVADLLQNRKLLLAQQAKVREKATERFHPDVILKQWDEEIFR